ncbi:MAG TPA: AmmeMemoRadiSam system protein B [Candidatus Bipolaricaulota bacterium]|nr:AmmeMemoRadiSam system protein B [Candidatus Bipolaricaulota bacterium]
MPLVFASIVPHPPIIIPSIGKDNINKVEKTIVSLKELNKDLIAANPEIIIVISPHGEFFADAFNINTNAEYSADFEQFGDFQTKFKYKPDLEFINRFKEQVETDLPIFLSQHQNLDHGSSVPLYYLAAGLEKVKIVPINYCLLSYQRHIEFGKALKEAIFNSDKRIAIVASGDLSHRLSKDAPAGFSKRGKEFDKKLIQLLKAQKPENIVNMDKDLIEEAGECGLRSILILLGVVKNMNYEFEVLSYEAPFGVGYLVGQFVFK